MKSIISGIFILLSLNIFAGDVCFNLAYETRGLVGAAEICQGVGIAISKR